VLSGKSPPPPLLPELLRDRLSQLQLLLLLLQQLQELIMFIERGQAARARWSKRSSSSSSSSSEGHGSGATRADRALKKTSLMLRRRFVFVVADTTSVASPKAAKETPTAA